MLKISADPIAFKIYGLFDLLKVETGMQSDGLPVDCAFFIQVL